MVVKMDYDMRVLNPEEVVTSSYRNGRIRKANGTLQSKASIKERITKGYRAHQRVSMVPLSQLNLPRDYLAEIIEYHEKARKTYK